jgi:ketosteroid isomerase-like protein
MVYKIYNETYEHFEPTVLEFTEGPHTVVVLVSAKVTGKKTGRTITMGFVEALRFEDGKIRSLIPYYFDTKLLVEL